MKKKKTLKEIRKAMYGNVSINKEKLFYFIFKDFIYLFMRDTERERSRDTGRGRSRLHVGSPMWDSIPGPQDHTLGLREMLNH